MTNYTTEFKTQYDRKDWLRTTIIKYKWSILKQYKIRYRLYISKKYNSLWVKETAI